MNYAVIMAGGAGTRFWPRSRKSKPKQFLNLFGPETMIQKTVGRLKGVVDTENIFVITNESYKGLVQEQLPGLNAGYIIGEPVARNTAPCIASAAALLYKNDPDGVMFVLPADHQVAERDEFQRLLKAAAETASKKNSLVTIGIKPDRPETGYGYIRTEESASHNAAGKDVYPVRNFTEKPDTETARTFLDSGDYLWNSGIFIWKVSRIVEAFQQHLPELYKHMERLMNSEQGKADIDAFYHACPSISIDYGIMEKAEHVHVVPGSFGWNDVGSWKSVYDLSQKDENGNAVGETTTVITGSASNLVYSESGKLVSLVGVENIAVVETEDAILVVNLDNAQDVKAVVEKLSGSEDLKRYL